MHFSIMMTPVRRRQAVYLAWLTAFSLPFLIFIYFTVRYAVNIPIGDDYYLILGNLNAFLTSDSLRDKAFILFRQYNEHRVLLVKLMALAQYYLSGKVNFRGLILAGNTGYILFVLFLCLQLSRRGFTKSQLLPIPYLLFSFTHFEIMLFASPSLDMYWGSLFALLFVVSLLDGRNIGAACLLYAIAIFNMGGGLVLFPLGIAFLLFQRRWKPALVFLVVASVVTWAYFYHYEPSRFQPSVADSVIHLDQAVVYFTAVLGSAFLSLTVAVVAGLGLTVLLLVFMTIHPDHQFLWLISAWLLLTAAGIAITRTGFGAEQALSSRYTIYSLAALVCVYAWIVALENAKSESRAGRILLTGIVLSAAFFAGVLLKYQLAHQFEVDRDRRIAGMVTFAATKDARGLIYPDLVSARNILWESRRLGVYDYKAASLLLPQAVDLHARLPAANSAFLGQLESSDVVHVSGWAAIPEIGSSASKVFVLLRDNTKVAQLSTTMIERPDVSQHYGTIFMYDYSGYEVYPAAYALPPGNYDGGVMVHNGNRVAIQWEQSSIRIVR